MPEPPPLPSVPWGLVLRGDTAAGRHPDPTEDGDAGASGMASAATSRELRTVDDAGDPRLDDYRDLQGHGGGRHDERRGVVVVEGRLAVQQVLRSGPPLRSVLVTPARAAALDTWDPAPPAEVPVLVAGRDVLERACGFDVHRGVLAAAPRPAARTPAALLARARRVAVLVGLNDAENLGAAFRTAAALGLDGVVVDDRCADPWSRRAVRVSQGWSVALPHARLREGGSPTGVLRAAGVRSVALTPGSDAVAVDGAAAAGVLAEPFALLVGAEGPGLPTDVLDDADARVRIPMSPGVDSLNVATALGVAAAFAAAARGWA